VLADAALLQMRLGKQCVNESMRERVIRDRLDYVRTVETFCASVAAADFRSFGLAMALIHGEIVNRIAGARKTY